MTSGDPISWSEIEAAAGRILDAPSPDQGPLLDALAASHPELHREVQSLLDADATCGDFLHGAAPSAIPRAARTDGSSPAPASPIQIPGYVVLRELGAGGMGTVVLARDAADELAPPVAIKLLLSEGGDDTTLRRFEREGAILASLTHRHIARHLGSGVTATGRPFLVMEYVDGSPLPDYADHHRLGVSDRVRLILDACRGVGHAHRSHVVHRDLKPSNVMVSVDAEVKVLDFGIARWMEGRAPSGDDVALTRTAQRVLTPRYASPEQIRGDVVGPPSDVFGLGLLLYETLTGRHPHPQAGWSVGEIERAILDLDPVPPSEAVLHTVDLIGTDGSSRRVHPALVAMHRGTDPDALQRELSGDLDAIVARALARGVNERYRDGDAVAQDLERWLEGAPVAASRPGSWRRATAWTRRRARRWRGEELSPVRVREVARHVRRADSLMSFLVRMFERTAPTAQGNPDLRARDLLDWAAAHVDDELGYDPDARVDLLTTLGRIYLEIGEPDTALPVLERAIEAARHLPGPRDVRVAATLRYLGTAFQELARFTEAEARFREALDLTRETYGPHHLEVASRMNDLAILLERRGDPARARSLHEEALGVKRRHLPDDDVSVLATLNNLGVLLQRMGHAREAQHLLRQVLATRRRRYGEEHVYVANALSNLMIAHRRLGDPLGAEPLAREALELRIRLLGTDHPDVAVSRFNLASILRDTGRLDEAEHLFEKAIEAGTRARGIDHPDTLGHRSGLAILRHRQGRSKEAEMLLTEICETMSRALGDRHPQLTNLRLDLARILLDRGRCEGAVALATSVVEIRTAHFGEATPLTSEAQVVRARALAAAGEVDTARDLLGRHLPVLVDAWSSAHPEVMRAEAVVTTRPDARAPRGHPR